MIRTERRLRLCVALIVCNIAVIWGNSLLPASVSAAISGFISNLLGAVLNGLGAASHGEGPLRKLAHFLEFTSFGLLLGWHISMGRTKKWILPTILTGVSVACVDETLQRFTPGRAPRITDVGIDTAGLLLGISLLLLGKYISKKKQNNKIGG